MRSRTLDSHWYARSHCLDSVRHFFPRPWRIRHGGFLWHCVVEYINEGLGENGLVPVMRNSATNPVKTKAF